MMIKSGIIFITLISTLTTGCEIFLQPDLLDGCTFDTIELVNPLSGFLLISGETSCGCQVDKELLNEQPILIYPEALETSKYLLLMIDKLWDGSIFLQWLVSDINGSELQKGLDMNTANTFVAYAPSNFLQSTTSIYIFEQRISPIVFDELPESRSDINLFEYLKLESKLCGPVAGIRFTTTSSNLM